MRLCVWVLIVGKPPPTYRLVPERASEFTPPPTSGFQSESVAAPSAVVRSARRLRPTPPMFVNWPPPHTSLFDTISALTVLFAPGFQSGATGPSGRRRAIGLRAIGGPAGVSPPPTKTSPLSTATALGGPFALGFQEPASRGEVDGRAIGLRGCPPIVV